MEIVGFVLPNYNYKLYRCDYSTSEIAMRQNGKPFLLFGAEWSDVNSKLSPTTCCHQQPKHARQ
jgi:hypothetical protein